MYLFYVLQANPTVEVERRICRVFQHLIKSHALEFPRMGALPSSQRKFELQQFKPLLMIYFLPMRLSDFIKECYVRFRRLLYEEFLADLYSSANSVGDVCHYGRDKQGFSLFHKMKLGTSYLVSIISLLTSSLSSISANSPSKEKPTFSSSSLYFYLELRDLFRSYTTKFTYFLSSRRFIHRTPKPLLALPYVNLFSPISLLSFEKNTPKKYILNN